MKVHIVIDIEDTTQEGVQNNAYSIADYLEEYLLVGGEFVYGYSDEDGSGSTRIAIEHIKETYD
jgi:hypothetical protein